MNTATQFYTSYLVLSIELSLDQCEHAIRLEILGSESFTRWFGCEGTRASFSIPTISKYKKSKQI